MTIAVYSPYLDTAGGGEKYILTIAQFLSTKGEVEVLLDKHLSSLNLNEIRRKNEKLHGLNLSGIKFVEAPLGQGSSLTRYKFLKKYDILFYNTDGSLFLSGAKKSFLHFQMPLKNSRLNNPIEKIKLKSWKGAIYNSYFTRKYIEEFWPIKGEVVYPPVDTQVIRNLKKKKQILSVGRFVEVKKQRFLIEAFKEIAESKDLEGWSLHLVGGLSDKEYFENLKKMAKGLKVYFYPNLDLKELVSLYGESSIYWHAMGYQESDPIKFEHFGISTVEAMAGGCVPVVIGKGGQSEIVTDGVNGFLWETKNQIQKLTINLIKNSTLMKKTSLKAIEKSKDFSLEVFNNKIQVLVYG